jgi:hypothetical protein
MREAEPEENNCPVTTLTKANALEQVRYSKAYFAYYLKPEKFLGVGIFEESYAGTFF